MARRGAITEAQVFEAADTLVAQGREVTPTVLLSVLGSGSFTTIYKHMAAWEASRVSAAVSQTPTEIPGPVQLAFATAWRVASTEAGREVTVAREKAAEEVAAAEKRFQEALQTIEGLETESESDNKRIESLTEKIAALESGLQKSENEKAALKATSDQLGQRVKSQEAELERVHKDLEAERKQHQAAQEKTTAAVKESAELRGQVEALKGQNSELLARLTPKPGREKS